MLIKSKALQKLQDLIDQFTSQGFKCSNIVEKQYNFEVNVSDDKQKAKLLVYFGKKGVSVIVQGNNESDFYNQISAITEGENLFGTKVQQIAEPDDYIGIDESGKGDFFGPLVIAAVYSDKVLNKQLLSAGVKDSKLLNDEQIKIAALKIKAIISKNRYNIISINPEKYNQLYNSFKNLNKLLAWGHSKAIENILMQHSVKTAISDKFGNEALILSELSKKRISINLIQSTKAERFTAVAAASILARERMLKWFKKTSEDTGILIPKGAGDVVNITLKKFEQERSGEILPKLVKLHFKNYKNYMTAKKG